MADETMVTLAWRTLTWYSDEESGPIEAEFPTFAEADAWAIERFVAGPTAERSLVVDHRDSVWAHYRAGAIGAPARVGGE